VAARSRPSGSGKAKTTEAHGRRSLGSERQGPKAQRPGEDGNPGEQRASETGQPVALETDSAEVPDPEVDRHATKQSCDRPWDAEPDSRMGRLSTGELPLIARRRDGNDKRGAGVERRYGFGWREKL
jgi:hypothetical protein